MILSVHQPNFIPWVGYFHKIACSDTFIILDQVQFPRGKSVANRNKINSSKGILDLVVPLSKIKGNEGKVNYNQILFADKNWHNKILKTIYYSYSKTKYFDEVYEWLQSIFHINNFCEMNVRFITDLCNKFQLKTKIILQSQIYYDFNLKNNDLIIQLCKITEANTYLSGHGAKAYNDNKIYESHSIKLIYTEFVHPIYPQNSDDFESHLSVLDMLFNLGFEETRLLLLSSVKV